jgi:hypothetical protein
MTGKKYEKKQPIVSELPDYYQWHERSPLALVDYVRIKLTPDLLIAVTDVFFPTFVEYKGAVILGFYFDRENFENWYEHFHGEIKAVEVMINHLEVASELFPEQLLGQAYENIEYVGEHLKYAWESELHRQFPDREFEVVGEKHDTFDDYVITIWQKTIQNDA